MKWLFLIAALLLLASLAAGGYFLLDRDQDGLAKVHQGIVLQFPKLGHINADRLTAIPAEDVVLFDVREESEFAVGHLKNAIRVDPAMSEQGFIEKFATLSKGKTAVFYCSVGQRSSDLANRTKQALAASGTTAVYNLEGGAFAWHNAGRAMVDASGKSTPFVHGYDRIWGRLVNDQARTRY